MADKAFFFRNVSNLYDLIMKTEKKINANASPTMYTVVKEIRLQHDEFIYFYNNFRRNFVPMYNYIQNMEVSPSGIWKCILIYNDQSKYSILVFANGYSYPRFTALVY
jgi:hypothetical protein